MIVRNCAGGIVFTGDKVLLVANDKEEWGFPKGSVKTDSDLSLSEFAKTRVKIETSLVNKCDMRISGKLSSAKLISKEGR